jgi:hypothetical protein
MPYLNRHSTTEVVTNFLFLYGSLSSRIQEFSKSLDPRRTPDPDQNRKNYLRIHNTALNKVQYFQYNTVPYQVSVTQNTLRE